MEEIVVMDFILICITNSFKEEGMRDRQRERNEWMNE